MRLPGMDPLQAGARVVETKPQAGDAHVSFGWMGLGADDVERVEVSFVGDERSSPRSGMWVTTRKLKMSDAGPTGPS
jgi:hypothetical protein